MKTLIQTTGLVLAMICSAPSSAQETLRVIDHGTDGDVRYYTVICPSGQRTSMSDYYVENKVCTMLVNGKEEVCRKDWDIDDAAKEACK